MKDCPTPFKLRFASRREARAAVLEITERRLERRCRKRVGLSKALSRLRVYECGCGGYHISTARVTQTRHEIAPEVSDW